jgi:hypothetical protein
MVVVNTPDEFTFAPSLNEMKLETSHTFGVEDWTRNETFTVDLVEPANLNIDVSGGVLGLEEGDETAITVNFSVWGGFKPIGNPVPYLQQMVAEAYKDVYDDTDITDWPSIITKFGEDKANAMLDPVFGELDVRMGTMYGTGGQNIEVTHIAHAGRECEIKFEDGTNNTNFQAFVKAILLSLFHESGKDGSTVGRSAVSNESLEIRNRIDFYDESGIHVYNKYKIVSNMELSYNAFVSSSSMSGPMNKYPGDSEPSFDPRGDTGDTEYPGDAE